MGQRNKHLWHLEPLLIVDTTTSLPEVQVLPIFIIIHSVHFIWNRVLILVIVDSKI